MILPAVQANTGWDVERDQGNVWHHPTSVSWQEREWYIRTTASKMSCDIFWESKTHFLLIWGRSWMNFCSSGTHNRILLLNQQWLFWKPSAERYLVFISRSLLPPPPCSRTATKITFLSHPGNPPRISAPRSQGKEWQPFSTTPSYPCPLLLPLFQGKAGKSKETLCKRQMCQEKMQTWLFPFHT